MSFFLRESMKGNMLRMGETLRDGEWLSSNNGRFQLKFESGPGLRLFRFDRNPTPTAVELYRWGFAENFCEPFQYLEMTQPGILVLMSEGQRVDPKMKRILPSIESLWNASDILKLGNGFMVVQDDGNVVMYPAAKASVKTAYWHSDTCVNNSVVAQALVPGTITLSVDGTLAILSDKTLVNEADRAIGVTDGTTSILVGPGQQFGVNTVTGTLALDSIYCDALAPANAQSGNTKPGVLSVPGPVKVYGPGEKYARVQYDSSVVEESQRFRLV